MRRLRQNSKVGLDGTRWLPTLVAREAAQVWTASFPMEEPSVPQRDPMIRALLCELETKLATLIETGETTRIDLRRLPLPVGGLQAIRDVLGNGEVTATMQGVGSCTFEETAVSGIWWIVQRNTAGDIVGEFIEIASVPDLLKADQSEMHASVERLRLQNREAVTPGARR